jgi:hypothetical protein
MSEGEAGRRGESRCAFIAASWSRLWDVMQGVLRAWRAGGARHGLSYSILRDAKALSYNYMYKCARHSRVSNRITYAFLLPCQAQKLPSTPLQGAEKGEHNDCDY